MHKYKYILNVIKRLQNPFCYISALLSIVRKAEVGRTVTEEQKQYFGLESQMSCYWRLKSITHWSVQDPQRRHLSSAQPLWPFPCRSLIKATLRVTQTTTSTRFALAMWAFHDQGVWYTYPTKTIDNKWLKESYRDDKSASENICL